MAASDGEDNGGAPAPLDHAGGFLSTVGGWLSSIPKAFRAPILKATNRLLFGLVNVPAAALEAKADDIKHAQQMRRKVRAALVAEAIDRIPGKQEVADRAVDYFVNDIIGKQENREAVLQYAVSELSHSAEYQQDTRVDRNLDDDWLNSFSRCAETAASERLQILFGQVLAGEIRKPGAYSLFTLDFLSKLGQRDAALITRIAPYVIWNMIILTKASQAVLDFELASALGALNIATATSIGATSAISLFKTEKNVVPSMTKSCALFSTNRNIFIVATDEPKEITVECTILTQVGSEVLSLHACDPDPQMLKELATKLRTTDAELYVGDIVVQNANSLQWRNLRLIAPENA
jgi:hypothetical protein